MYRHTAVLSLMREHIQKDLKRKIMNDNPDVREGLLFVGEKLIDIEEGIEFANQLLTYDGRYPQMFTFISMAQMRTVHPPNSANFEMQDRNPIDLDNLVDLSEDVNEGLEEVENEENTTDNVFDGDTSWFDSRLGIGPSHSPFDAI
ncbi:hypothetical protein BVC80_8427g9 [Macleaya cordata]|uniref:Uncharacterized protein n=1 Tax=Macleaya cordata TaxID=56857 RepID=A0A200Q7E5_MACCD|nr:hypothetical protein BVC80_8427g9 [Macleaya cordata]